MPKNSVIGTLPPTAMVVMIDPETTEDLILNACFVATSFKFVFVEGGVVGVVEPESSTFLEEPL